MLWHARRIDKLQMVTSMSTKERGTRYAGTLDHHMIEQSIHQSGPRSLNNDCGRKDLLSRKEEYGRAQFLSLLANPKHEESIIVGEIVHGAHDDTVENGDD